MFFQNYVRLCNKAGISPSAAAVEMGIAKPTVSRWKSGSKPNSATLQKIADYFHVSVESLTDETNVFYNNFLRLCSMTKESPSGVAKAIGLSNAAANGWKNGKIPTDVTLQKLSAHFHVPVESLTEEKPTPTGQQASGGVEVTPLEAELLAAYRRLSPAQRQALLALLGIESQP